MRGFRIRRLMGHNLLQVRRHRRALPMGECQRCGQTLAVATDCWLDAERVVAEHESSCQVETVIRVRPSVPPRARPVLRPA